MKKITALLLALILVLTMLVGCDTAAPAPDAAAVGPDGTLEEILENIYATVKPEFDVITMPIDLSDADSVKYFTGLDASDKVEEALVSESALGAQAYSLVLVRVNDAADAAQVAEEMKVGIDPRKWICVGADDLRVAGAGDVVMLIMLSTEYADAITAEAVVTAFADLCGGSVSIDLK